MSNIKPDDFRKHAAEEDFFRLVAMEIESEQNEEFLEAQNLPDPSPEVLQRMQTNLQMTMRRTRKRKRRHTIFLHLGRFTACAAVIFGVLFSGAYFGVEATKNSINNFVLELFTDHSVIRTKDSTILEGASLPADWNGPFNITWVPARFSSVRVKSISSLWSIIYESNHDENTLSIYVWSSFHSPHINTENSQLIEEDEIQDAPVSIYESQNDNSCILIWTKEDYIIEIGGAISIEEAKKIAESFVF